MGQLWKHAPSLVQFFSLILFVLPLKTNSSDPTASPSNLINHLGCSFVSKSCSWENVDKWSWVMPSYSAIKLDSPAAYASSWSSSSYSLQTNFSSISSQSYMTSPQFTVGGNVACLSFGYYFMINSNRNSTNSLSLTLIDTGRSSESRIWSANAGIVLDQWSVAQVQIDQTGTYKIKLFATGQEGFIAVNNFLLRNRECPTRVCDFESGNCGWTVDGSNPGFTVTLSAGTGGKLKSDHTSRSAYGHVVYLDTNNKGSSAGSIARLQSPPMASLQAQCFSFWLMQNGVGLDLNLYQYHINTKQYDLIWHNRNRTHLPDDEWIRVQNSLQITDQVKLIFEAKWIKGATGSAQLDDIGLTPFSCDPPVSCTFEQDFCGWKEETTKSKLLWTIGHGRVWDPTKLADQASIAAFDVLYTDFTTIKSKSESMELLSEMVDVPAQGGACVGFRYRVKSFFLDSDAFQLVQISANTTRTVVWSFNDTKLLNYWQTVSVYLSNDATNNLPYRLSLYAKSSNPSTYLAVRSFQYDTNVEKCGHGEKKTTVPPTSTAAQTLSPSQSLTCNFEQNNLCNWKTSSFKVGSPISSFISDTYFPARDHTTDSQYGHMAYLANSNNIGRLGALNPFGLQQICFEFYYYFFSTTRSSDDREFKLKLSSEGESVVIFRVFAANEIKWRRAALTITPILNYTHFMFSASVSQGILAIDDINVRLGACPDSGASTSCDFEQGTTCMFEPVFNSVAIWKVFEANSLHIPDHTTHSSDGHYYGMQLTMAPNGTEKQTFVTQSKRIDGTKVRCLTFSYLLASVHPSTVLFYEIEQSGQQIVKRWKTAGNTVAMWFTHRTALPAITQIDIRMGIETVGEVDGKVLVDDIHLDSAKCDYPHIFGLIKDFVKLREIVILKQVSELCWWIVLLMIKLNLLDMCGWSNGQTSSSGKHVLWMRIQPNSRFIQGQLLKYDHTTMNSNGNYLILPLAMAANAYSVLKSPLIRKNTRNTICLSMWYFAQTRHSKTSVVALTVRLVDITRRKTTDVQVHATDTLQWTQFSTQFHNLPSAFVIEIEVNHIQRDIQSDVGLDDIRMDECGEKVVPTTTTQIPPTEKMLNCNFDNAECNWNYDQNSWKVGTFLDQKNIYAPKMDHTLQTTNGKYMMFQQQGTSDQNSETAPVYKIMSTKNVTYDKDHCITLWYYEDSQVSFSLDVYIVLPTFVVPVSRFSSAIENQKRWNLLKADIDYISGYDVETIQVQIRFSTSSKQKFLIFALDDIVMKPGKCQHKHDYVYTFTSGLEDLELEYIQPIQDAIGLVYLPSSSPNHSLSIVPSVDHTTNTPNGKYFLFMNQKTFASTTYIDTLTTLDLPRDDSKSSSCLRFAYQISGNVTLKVFIAPINANTFYYYTKSADILWKPKFDKTSWTIMEINKRILYEHKVVFYMEKEHEDKTSYLALDDITVLSHQCQNLINCDFEDGRVCSYSPIDNKTEAQYNFGLFQAPTQDPNWPGPKYDHTTKNYGSGYLYLTAYQTTNFEKLHSKVISAPRTVDPTKMYCLTLWTRITTTDLVLSLHLIRFGTYWTDSNRTLTLTTMTNLTQPDWTLLALTLDQSTLVDTYEAQLLIEGTIEANSTGLIAIDDILLMEDSQCQSDGLLCENGVKLTREKICNFVKDCPSGLDELNCGNCDFESGTCGWMNMTTYDLKWLLTNANESQSANALPTLDGNSNPSGHYLLMSKPDWDVGSNAETALNFPTPSMYLKNAFKTCVMQFDYFIRTTNYFSLQVRIGRDRVDWATIFTITQQSTGWHKAYVHIGHRYSQFMVDIVGHADSCLSAIMAIDNIQFANCSMPKPLDPNQKCSNKDEFKCINNRFCVSKDDICDYVNECGDGSDELGCTNWALGCNFETSLSSCGIKTNGLTNQNQNKANVEWNLKMGRLNRDIFEPTIDNTRHDGYGQYLVLEPVGTVDQQSAGTADFYTHMLTSKIEQNCRMRFFYYINGELVNGTKSGIEIYVQYAKNVQPELEPIARITILDLNSQQQRWNKAVTEFKSADAFQFVFRGHIGSTNWSRIAVDDISFDQNCVASSVVGQSPTTKPPTQPPMDNSSVTDPTTFIPPTITREKNDNKSPKGKIVAAILIPLFLVLVAVGTFFGYRKYQESQRSDRNIIMSMKDIKDDQ